MKTDSSPNTPNTKSSTIFIDQPIFPIIGVRRRVFITWPVCMDAPLAQLIGMLIHNGKVSRDENLIQVRNTSKFFQFEETLTELLAHLNLELNVKSRTWSGMFQQQAPRISNTEFTQTFLNILECTRLDQLLGLEKIPNAIKKSSLEVQKAFLDGYLCTCPCKFVIIDGRRMVQVVPYVKEFVIELSDMLKLFNVDCELHEAFFYTNFGTDLDT